MTPGVSLRTLGATLAIGALALAAIGAAPPAPAPSALVAHEWGTFTSVAATDGTAANWQPLGGPQDLPCFVQGYDVSAKTMIGRVRMETPVIYFYTPTPTTVRVSVQFRRGLISEWYPVAKVPPASAMVPAVGSIEWPAVRVTPGAAQDFPVQAPADSHYYAARETDATPIEVDGQQEKFLFYRGLGTFQPPISATLGAGGRITIASQSGAPLGTVIAFENRDGALAYQVRSFRTSRGELGPLAHNGEAVAPLEELEDLLVAEGLYEKEAKAMVATWRDSWFEPGTRLFYIAPKAFVEDTLPLRIAPAPASITRVFVGRIELVTPDRLAAVHTALRNRDTATLLTYGRFLQPVADRIRAEMDDAAKGAIDEALTPVYRVTFAAPARSGC